MSTEAPTGLPGRILARYRRLFHIREIEQSCTLQWLFGATLFSFFLTFNSWTRNGSFTVEAVQEGKHTCWPFFPNCGDYYFLSALPDGYSQSTAYMILFAVMAAIVYLMWKKSWAWAHLLMGLLLAWKLLVMFFSYNFGGNYDYFHIAITIPLLFFPHKLFFSRMAMLAFYFLAGTIKVHEGWILGTYFSTMKTGMPLFPDSTIPIWTNLVIGLETVGIWFLLSSDRRVQRLALAAFIFFHLYSGILVEYRYPATVMPALLILFGPSFQPQPVPLGYRSALGWSFLALMAVIQLIPRLIPGDEALTREGGKLGLYMFEANHQYISYYQVFYTDGRPPEERVNQSHSARKRCDPYRLWFRLKQRYCEKDSAIERIEWKLAHSINGNPFYQIVDVENACELNYRPFRHNDWIKTPEEGAPAVGVPVQNLYD